MTTQITWVGLLKHYSTDEKCLKALFERRFPQGAKCKKCGRITKHYKIKKRLAYACSRCGNHLYPLAGTVFEKSTTPLPTWFYAIFLMTATRAGVSAKQLQRQTGVTYKTAWRMFHQIRKLMQSTAPSFLTGVVEIDETYVGGKSKNKKLKWSQGTEAKEVVMGMVEREGFARLVHIETNSRIALMEQIEKYVDPKSHIMTDELSGYQHLTKSGYKHGFVKHSVYQYRYGNIHTQNIENVWSHFKRGIYGVYRKVSRKHLQKYVDEFAFRYNYRFWPGEMFETLISQLVPID